MGCLGLAFRDLVVETLRGLARPILKYHYHIKAVKKLILTTFWVLIVAANAAADGLINFLNSPGTLITLSSNGMSLGSMPGLLGQFKFELFVATTGATDPMQFVATGLMGTNISAPGRFIGGNNLTVHGVQPGLNGAILVRGWSSSLGSDYDSALSWWKSGAGGFLGESEIATPFLFGGDDGTGVIPTSTAFGGNVGIQHGFVLTTIPEPSVLALFGLLGGTILVLGRRPLLRAACLKQIVVAVCTVGFLTSSAFGGVGTINFINSFNTRVTLQTPWGQDLGPMPGYPAQFTFQLFIAPAGTTDTFQFVPTSIRGTNLSVAGRFTGGFNLGVPGVQAGESRSILVRGWSTALGDSYETALANWNWANGFLGQSPIASNFFFGGIDDYGSPIPPSPAFGGAFGIQSGFALVGVPEPSACALFASGIALLMMFGPRRRQTRIVNSHEPA